IALAKIVGLAVTPRIPSATSRPSVPSRRYTRVRLSSQGLWLCSSYRRWSLVMSSLLSSVVPVGEHIGFGPVPHGMVTGEVAAGEVVQPGALAVAVVELVQLGHRVLLVISAPVTWSRGMSGSASRAGSTGSPLRIRAWMGSVTSQTLAFMPATTRWSLSQKAMNVRAAGSPRTTTRSQVAANPEYSIPRSYWSEKK